MSDPNPYPKKPPWAVSQILRSTGLIEDVCEHGIGHPNAAWLAANDPDGARALGVHGCDGCCAPDYKDDDIPW